MYCPRRCRKRMYKRGAENTSVHGGRYWVDNGSMRNFVPTNLLGTAFAPKQWLYQKEATGRESSKMYCPGRCRKRTYQCGAVKKPTS